MPQPQPINLTESVYGGRSVRMHTSAICEHLDSMGCDARELHGVLPGTFRQQQPGARYSHPPPYPMPASSNLSPCPKMSHAPICLQTTTPTRNPRPCKVSLKQGPGPNQGANSPCLRRQLALSVARISHQPRSNTP